MNLARFRAAIAVLRGKAPAGYSTPDNSRGWLTLFNNGRPPNFQNDTDGDPDQSLAFFAVYSCLTQIASDIGKLGLGLRELVDGIWRDAHSAAFSPVLRRPNPFQTSQQFIECWLISKLGPAGNFYALKERDERGVVVRLYPLDPHRVKPLVAPNGEVFYELKSDDLARLPFDVQAAPASEIIHDRSECLFHPLVGISPLYACSLAATQGLKIQNNSAKFFANMSRPSGVLTAPGQIGDDTARRIKEHWEDNFGGDKIGKVAVLGDSLAYVPMAVNPEDAQLVEQLKLSAEQVCSAYHVPPFMIGVGGVPSYDNVQALTQWYYSQCLQKLIESIERLLDDGLGLKPGQYRTEFDLDDLLRMDGKTLAEVEGVKVQRGIAAPNEARRKFNLAPVTGGDVPYLQQQNFSLEALAKRDAQEDPFGSKTPPPATAPPAPPEVDEETETEKELKRLRSSEAELLAESQMLRFRHAILRRTAQPAEEAFSE